MKKRLFDTLLCICTLFVSCKKSAIPEESTYLLKVREHKTNVPLPGVKISLYKCSNYDPIFGCRSRSVVATRSTNQDGEYGFTQAELNMANEGIVLSRPQYFDTGGGPGEIFMQPEAIVQLAFKASKVYPDTSIIDISVSGELGAVSLLSFKAPADSVVNFRLFGNEVNDVKWVLYTTLLPCVFYCPRDTLAYGSLLLNPKKFEILTSSVDY